MAGLPDLLTIEEAARVIRVGRTKAYAMAREWRATGGRSGLPVVDFGHVLRVPRCQLELIVGGPLNAEGVAADAPVPSGELEATQADESLSNRPASTRCDPPACKVCAVTNADPSSTARCAPRRPSRRRTRTPDQPTLPFAS